MRLPHLTLVQTVLAILASITSITSVVVTIMVTVGPLSPGDGSNEDGPSTPTATDSTSEESTPSSDAEVTPVPTGSLFLVGVTGCAWERPSTADSVAELQLGLKIAGNPDFSRQVPIISAENGRTWSDSIEIQTDEWEPENDLFVVYVGFNLELKAEDLGKLHEIVVRADPNNITEGFDQSKNETSVRVFVPETTPIGFEELDECTSPIP